VADPLVPRRASWARCWLEGAGAAILLCPGLLWTELSRTHIDLYHRLLPLTTVQRALAVDLVALSLLAMVVIRLLDRVPSNRVGSRFAGGRSPMLLLWALWLALLAARAVAGLIVAQVLWWQQITTARVFLLALLLALLLWLISARAWKRTVQAVRFGILLLGFCIFWMVPLLISASLVHQPWDQPSFQKPLAAAPAAHPRIVWLLFDEMSYQQVFGHRWPGLELPNLDRLRTESVTFSSIQPDGYFTEDVIPSLLLGKPIDEVRATSSGWMIYRSGTHGSWRRFDGNQTLFQDALRIGWTTGAIGSYNPYCRILKDQLDFCWMDMPPLPDHLSRSRSTVGNVLAPLAANWQRISADQAHVPASGSASSLDTLGAVRAANALIADPQIDICFVHLPLPHPPGDYNRITGKIGAAGSYIDNLALSDRILGQLLTDIAQSPAASRTTLLLSSDHSWRTWIWRNSFGWTHEDEVASDHGQFDPRPMLMVRFPGQTSSIEVSHPVPLLGIHDLIEKSMAGQIGNPQQLQSWAAQQQGSDRHSPSPSAVSPGSQ
jgi:hypothetical protein